MPKIAVVDFLFHWPPDGGSRVDLKEVFSRVAKFHDVKLFVPHFTRYYPRGEILEAIPIDIEQIPFNRFTYNLIQLPGRIKEAVDKFSPDYLFIADGELLKPYVVNALKKYKPILRFYTYDSFCIKDYGTFFSDGSICLTSFLDTPFHCIKCTAKWILKNKPRMARHTFMTSLAFLPGFSNIVKRSLKNASTVIVYNEFIKKIAEKYNPNCLIVPSGVDTGLFKPLNSKVSNKVPVVLMTGRIGDPGKGFETLYRACKILYEKGKSFKLLVTSDKKFDEPFVESCGWHNPNDLPSLYNQADICIVPSIWQEPFGIVALEAMACGKPVIVSRVGGLMKTVEDGKSGFLFSAGDEEDLAFKIELLLENRTLRSKMGEAARERVEKEYNWDKIVEKYYLPLFK